MNQHRIAALTRSLTHVPSRRDVLRGFASGVLGLGTLWLEGAQARNKHRKKHKRKKTKAPSPPAATCTPRCGRKVCGDDGCGGSCGNCAPGQSCRSGTCCTPEPSAVTCVGRCGTVIDNICHLPVACSCPSGQACLSNGSCAAVCSSSATICPVNGSCDCGSTAEGTIHCVGTSFCDLSSQVCTSTAECPVGQLCRVTNCGPAGGPENRCWPLCDTEPA
jgi:hypothetical protein